MSTNPWPRILLAIGLCAGIALLGCPSSDDDDSAGDDDSGDDDSGDDDSGDDDSGDDDSGDSYEVTVTWPDGSATVDLFTLTATDWEGSPAAPLPDLLADAGVATPASYTYAFTAVDDYMREGFVWDDVQQAVLIQATGDLEWPDALGFPGADFVSAVVDIDATVP